MSLHRSFAWHHAATLALTLLLIGPISGANGQQAKQPSRSELQAEIVRLRAALADCQNAKQAANLNSAREDAITSLRAVGSALSTGANLEEFKKYQIESRIKVDALPNIPENHDIRAISDLYREAVTFGIMSVTGGKISAEDLAAEKSLHGTEDASDKAISKALADMMSEDAVEPYVSAKAEAKVVGDSASLRQQYLPKYADVFRGKVYEDNQAAAKVIVQYLIIEAKYRLPTLK
jgi:hypothetical protein